MKSSIDSSKSFIQLNKLTSLKRIQVPQLYVTLRAWLVSMSVASSFVQRQLISRVRARFGSSSFVYFRRPSMFGSSLLPCFDMSCFAHRSISSRPLAPWLSGLDRLITLGTRISSARHGTEMNLDRSRLQLDGFSSSGYSCSRFASAKPRTTTSCSFRRVTTLIVILLSCQSV